MKRPHPSGADHWTRRMPEHIQRGARSHAAVLTESDHAIIRAEFASGRATQVELAERYRVSRATIWRHIHGRHE